MNDYTNDINNKYTLRNSFLINFLITKDFMKFIIALRPDYNGEAIETKINHKKAYFVCTLMVKDYKLIDYLMMTLDTSNFPKILGMKRDGNRYKLIYKNNSYIYSFLEFEAESLEWTQHEYVKYRNFRDIKSKEYYTLLDRRYSGEYVVDLGR